MKVETNFVLLRARMMTGLTQVGFAAKIGMMSRVYGDIERNRINPTMQEKKLIADGLNLKIKDLWG